MKHFNSIARKALTPIIIFFFPALLFAQNKVIIPESISGKTFHLELQRGHHQFYPGQNTSTMGANGSILGPTLIMQKGDYVDISVLNNLGETSTIHWHGMHVSAENDGGPHTTISDGTTWNPKFTVMDHAGTYWYHPHLHEKTNEHVSKGIAGFIIVRDSEEAALNLPRDYGIDDFPLAIQTKDFDANKQIISSGNSDDVVVVNATIDGILDVPAQVVRLRLLNGSSQRVFNLGLSDNTSFYQIATDGGLLNQSIAITRLILAPGERAEILIDFSSYSTQELRLMSFASELPSGIYGASSPGTMPMMTLDGYNPNPLNGTDFSIFQFNLVAQTANPVSAIPQNLVAVNPIPEASADVFRSLTFTPETMGPNQLNGHFLINGKSFAMDRIDYRIPLNNTEVWTIYNQSAIAHPFHIHDVQFFVLDRNGSPPPATERGRKDVILVKAMETVRIITKFEDFANEDVPYMFHCHMLVHEDAGMMGQFIVYDTSTGKPDIKAHNGPVSMYPNPSSDFITISSDQAITEYQIHNMLGSCLISQSILLKTNQLNLNLSHLPKGLYMIKVKTQDKYHSKRIVMQ